MLVQLVDDEVAAGLVREMRAVSGMSQRELAAASGTSGPTIAYYEKGSKEPRLSTLQRMAASVGLRVDVRLRPALDGGERRRRRERRSLAIAAATAAAVERDFPLARKLAEENLERMSDVVGDNPAGRWIDDWRRAIEGGPAAVRIALVEPGERGHDM